MRLFGEGFEVLVRETLSKPNPLNANLSAFIMEARGVDRLLDGGSPKEVPGEHLKQRGSNTVAAAGTEG